MFRYSLFDPFTMPRAEKFRGKRVSVEVFDLGFSGSYTGVLEPVSPGRTKVGDEMIFNECIVGLQIHE